MDFQLAGLASGFDWKTMVDQLMAIERIPQQRMRSDQGTNTSKINALETLETKLGSLNTNVEGFDSSSLYNAKSISLSDDTLGIKGTASTSASVGSHSVTISNLASATKRTGTADVGGSMGTTGTVITNLRLETDISEGTFSINGQDVAVSSGDTLQDVFDAISVATSGVVTASYDGGTDKISLSSASGELELGGSGDDSNFLTAMKLDQFEVIGSGGTSTLTSTKALGVVDSSSSIADSGIGGGSPITGSGTIIINGVSIDFDADSDSMSALQSRINDSAANVTMSYDSTSDQYRMVNNETGAYQMSVSDSGNGMLAALGLDGSADVGDNLAFSLDGGATQYARSNSIDSDDHGITGLTITATETGTQTIGVARDSSELKEKIDKFISAYNDVQDFILEKTKIENKDDTVTLGDLAGNREISALDSNLRKLAFDRIDGMGGDIFRLEHLGIDFISGTSKLEVKDSSALDEALAGNLDDLETFFMNGESSFSGRMTSFVEGFTASDGILDYQKENLESQNTKIDAQIEEMERRLEFKKSALEAGFIAMETAQSNIQTQQSALSSLANDT